MNFEFPFLASTNFVDLFEIKNCGKSYKSARLKILRSLVRYRVAAFVGHQT